MNGRYFKFALMIFINSMFVNIKALNILFVTGFFPHHSQFFIQNQIEEMIIRGHNVHIHALNKKKYTSADGVVLNDNNILDRTTYGKKIPNCVMFDIVYIQFGYHAELVVDQLAQQNYKGKIVVCFRGNDLSGKLTENIHKYDLLFNRVDLFLPVCDFFKQKLLKLGCRQNKIEVLHSPIDISKFFFKNHELQYEKKLRLISISRILKKKGLEYVIQAVAILKQRYPHIEYIIIGDSSNEKGQLAYKQYLKDLVKALNLEKQVIFYGWIAHDKVASFLDEADIFLLTSVTSKRGDTEGIPNVVKEAMAAGVPVIVTDHAGNNELVEDKVTGLIVPERDVDAIVNSVQSYVNNPNNLESITMAARCKVEKKFDIVPVMLKLEKLCNKLIKKN